MPGINFPDNPTLNDEFTSGNRTWVWNGVAWEAYGTYIGATGPTGPTGSAAAITASAPVVYDNVEEQISLNYGLGLILAGEDLAVYTTPPVQISGGAVTLNTGAGLKTESNALTVNTTSGITTANGAIVANVNATSGLTVTNNAISIATNAASGLTQTGNALSIVVNTATGLTQASNAIAISLGSGLTVNAANAITIDNSVVTLTGTQLVSNKEFVAPREQVVINTASALTTGTSINALAGAIVVYTTTPSANAAITLSLGVSGTAGSMANTLPNTGDSITIGVFNPSGASFATFINAIQIDGSVTNVTTQWQLGAVPTQVNTGLSSTDSYLFTVVNTNTATSPKTYRVFASRTRFA